jgi:hypothetical protein
MACCGDKRAQVNLTRQQLEPGKQSDPVFFQYTGRTGLTVIGRETGLRYRFDSPGAVIAVDGRDRLALTFVPNLRQVKSPTS